MYLFLMLAMFLVVPVFLGIWGLVVGRKSTVSRPVKILYLIFWVISFLFCAYSPTSDFLNLREALLTGKCSVVAGAVTDFVPMPGEGHKNESFKVQGTGFSYSDYSPQAGFNNSSSHGGPIKEGLKVRISYLTENGENEIAKLEIVN